MKSLDVIPKAEQERFWRVVRQCIRVFHSRCASTTLPKAARLRKKVNDMPVEQRDLFYHAEPFDVACDLAGKRLDVREYQDEYLKMRDS
jgi:hypothetical protein